MADFGISVSEIPKTVPPDHWAYWPVAENRKFVMAIFGLRQGQRLPMHDHPGMTVLMKPLFGSLRIHSFTKDGPICGRRVRIKDERIQEISRDPDFPVWEIGVDTGNDIHEIKALTDCAFVDLVVPPYEAYGERSITYFEKSRVAGFLDVVPERWDHRSTRLELDLSLTQ